MDFFSSKKLAPGDLGLLQQYRHIAAVNQGALCPQLAKADIMAERVHSGFDPKPTYGRPIAKWFFASFAPFGFARVGGGPSYWNYAKRALAAVLVPVALGLLPVHRRNA